MILDLQIKLIRILNLLSSDFPAEVQAVTEKWLCLPQAKCDMLGFQTDARLMINDMAGMAPFQMLMLV